MSDLTPQGIMQLGLGFWGSKTLFSAIELGVFTELAEGDLEAGGLTERLQLNSRGNYAAGSGLLGLQDSAQCDRA